MQIGGNYRSYSNSDYNYGTHTHHVTECLHEEQPLRKKGETASNAGVILEIHGNEERERAAELRTEIPTRADGSGGKKGFGFLKGIWDAMGESEEQAQNVTALYERKDPEAGRKLMQNIHAVVAAIRQAFHWQITGPFETVREKIKVGISAALKRFGGGNEPFGALTDPGTGTFLEQRTGGKKEEHGAGSGTRKDEDTLIKTPEISDEHLMDSYSKNGTYCKLNENLTYWQGRTPYKVSDKNADK